MKTRWRSFAGQATAVMVIALAITGCSNPNVDTAKVRAKMQGIGPQMTSLNEALADIDAGKYKEALLPLRRVAYGAKMTTAQVKLLEETIAKVRAKLPKEQSNVSPGTRPPGPEMG